MVADDRQTFDLVDEESRRLHATWSRSGRRLLVTIFDRAASGSLQVELSPAQVAEFAAYLGQRGS